MRLYQKLVLVLLAAVVAPPSIVGFRLLATGEAALVRQIEARQAEVARGRAQALAAALTRSVSELQRASTVFPLAELSSEERDGALAVSYRSITDAAAVLLVDARGDAQAKAAFPPAMGGAADASAETIRAAELRASSALGELRAAGDAALLAPYADARGRFLPVVIRVEGEDGPWVLAAELALPTLLGPLLAAPESSVRVLDAQGLALLGAAAPEGAQLRALVDVPIAGLGWRIEASTPLEPALAPVRNMRRTVVFSVGTALLLLVGLALAFSRNLGGRLAEAERGALEFARGALDYRIPLRGRDELTNLTRTLNTMGAELLDARNQLVRWNEELQREVEKRTEELTLAQRQLAETQKLAAIGQLGAGVAHEINNPLAGILGNVQLMLAQGALDERSAVALRRVEEAAKRCRVITTGLLLFSQGSGAGANTSVELNRLVEDALALVAGGLAEAGVELELALDPAAPRLVGDPAQLQQVILHVVANAKTALRSAERKKLRISTAARGEQVQLEIEDTGKGISSENLSRVLEPFFTTKDDWTSVGLGLSMSYRIITDHDGQLAIRSQPDQGTTVSITLPVNRAVGEADSAC